MTLSILEQSELAFKCVYLEFSRGESFIKHPRYGRGIMIPRKGMAMKMGTVQSHGINAPVSFEIFGIDDPTSVNDVLVEDSALRGDLPQYRFLCYSLVVFIPQSVIFETLEAKKEAWKKCARWRYLQTCLLKLSRHKDDDVREQYNPHAES